MGDLYNRQRRYERRKSAEAADIGPMPAVVNTERREACRLDLRKYLVTYFPMSTGLKPFSKDHEDVIELIQRCILFGGRFANAVYRGFAKTTISENSSIWATSYGHRGFVPIFGSDATSAQGNIESIKMELSGNDLLYEDFPEICHPIRALEGRPQRCGSQTFSTVETCPDCKDTPNADCKMCKGKGTVMVPHLTHIEWTADTIVLPTIPGSVASGAIISCKGLTATIRGMKHKRADGTQQRPDFAIIDDPQTDESARTPLQVNKRINVIKKSILKLCGHSAKMAVVMNATVIEPDDLVDQFLDHKRNPSWQGKRIPMVRQWSKAHDTLWMEDYARIRTTYDPDVPGSQKLAQEAATQFYKDHRAEMDEGAIVSWEWCYNWQDGSEISAIQHAYNALIDDGDEVFASEYQNQPKPANSDQGELKSADILKKIVKMKRGIVPVWATTLTAFIDVQDHLLYGGVMAFGPGFRSHIVDYRTYPDQKKAHFAYRDAKIRYSKQFASMGKEGALREALDKFTDELLGTTWKREDGPAMAVSLCPIDAGDGDHSDVVYTFCNLSKYKGILVPSKGRSVGAKNVPWEMFPRRAGEQMGHHWLVAPLAKGRVVRLLQFDTNYWKSFVQTGLATAVGGGRSMEIFDDKHPMLIDHLLSEYGTKTTGHGREVTEWQLRVGRDNHFLDMVVGCCVGASVRGIKLNLGMAPVKQKAKQRAKVSYL
jgi:hypothetical protein